MSLSTISPLPDQEDVIEALVDPQNEELNYNEDFGGEYVDNAGDEFQEETNTLTDYDPDTQYDNQDVNDIDDDDDPDNPIDYDDPDNPDNQSVAVYDRVYNPQEAQSFINRLSKPLQSSSKSPSTIPLNSPTSYVIPSSRSSSFQPKVSPLKVPTSPVQQSSMEIINNLPSVSNANKSPVSKKN